MSKEEKQKDTTCLVCGHQPTSTGFICRPCYNQRLGTIHPAWTDPIYYARMVEQGKEPISNAAEARFALKQQQRQNRFTREEISA